jgi:predicted secreted hydrolase
MLRLRLFLIWGIFCPLFVGAAEIPARTAEGFAVPQPGAVFSFPRDHGSHPDYKIEWWYLTGHLFAADGRHFGYQATFFRNAAPRVGESTGPANFGTDHIHLAHMALLDVRTGRFLHQERLNRDGWDANASTDTLNVRNGDWSLGLTDAATETLALRGGIRADARFTLTLAPTKPLVRFGEDGYSKKGATPTAASYYLTFTRLRTAGTLTLGEETFAITGETWMDHEYSSSQLTPEQVGWDWLSVHFDDGRELMLYRLRLRAGGHDPASTLTWVDVAGATRTAPFEWAALTSWRSPHTGAEYPQRVRLSTTDPANGQAITFFIEPLAADQELTGTLGGVAYYEGACRVLTADGRVVGRAYMELTGYAAELKL